MYPPYSFVANHYWKDDARGAAAPKAADKKK
jgi:hypothetical protein